LLFPQMRYWSEWESEIDWIGMKVLTHGLREDDKGGIKFE
jgi:hypothetical protein